MAINTHSTLTGRSLHESKGAAEASAGQVAIANGLGSAPFAFLNYSYLTGKPFLPQNSFSGEIQEGAVLIKHYLVTASGGLWTQALSGFTTIFSVQAQTLRNSISSPTSSYTALVSSQSASSVSGSVMSLSGSLGTTQQVMLTVYGV